MIQKNHQNKLRKCDKESLKITFEFLGGNSDNLKKDELIEFLVLKVKSFFPDICQICQNEYCFKLDDEKFLSCGSCGQEVHRQCLAKKLQSVNISNEDVQNLFRIPSFHYLCANCEKPTICLKEFSFIDQQAKTQSHSDINDKLDDNSSPTKIQPYLSPKVILRNRQSTLEEDDISLRTKKQSNTEYMRKKLQKDYENNLPLSSENSKINNEKICRFYKNGVCRYGLSGKNGGNCSFSHPKPCNKPYKTRNKQ